MTVIPFDGKGGVPPTSHADFTTMYTIHYYDGHYDGDGVSHISTVSYVGVGFVAGDCFVIQDTTNWAPLFVIPTSRMLYATTEQVEVDTVEDTDEA